MSFSVFKKTHRNQSSAGFTFIELLVVMVLASILATIGMIRFADFNNSLNNDVGRLKNFIGKIKLKAMSHTEAYKITNINNSTVEVYYAANCDSKSWTKDVTETFKLSDKVSFTETDWSVCFNSRGFPDNVLTFSISDEKNKSATLNLMLGGAFYVQES